MINVPKIKTGLVAVSRDCFPSELSKKRRRNAMAACRAANINVTEILTLIENERDVTAALQEIFKKDIDALVIYLGNFGPEGPLSLLAQKFPGPVMVCAAAEEKADNLIDGRGDAYCGMLNASYNLKLRGVRPHIPEYPVGTADAIAAMINDFIPAARAVLGLKGLKILSFGPRPQDFLACNAPIKPLYDLGVEVMENSELDLYDLFNSARDDRRIPSLVKKMAAELGQGNAYPDLLKKLAQYEIALLKFHEQNKGASRYAVFANKCWPSFEKYFGFVPCFVNSRLAAQGIPVSCETDIYGALSEYAALCATGLTPTLLDINNTVPEDMYKAAGKKARDYSLTDLFMGFHCGNTASCCLSGCSLKYQLIMHRLMEPGKPPDITRGTLEGVIRPGPVTLFRLQSTADACLRAYVAEGEVLDINPRSFGGIGVFGIREMGRFYRHVLIGRQFPHHAAVGFAHAGKALFAALKMLGVSDISFNRPRNDRYPEENPFGSISKGPA